MALRSLGIGALLLLLAAAPAPVSAHHSFAAEYDGNQPIKLTGAVTKIEWTNPHVYFYIDVKNPETGRLANWAMEMAAPSVIARNGWKRSSMKIGDLVIVEGFRARSGDNHANARSVTLAATGQKLGAGGGDPNQ
jgi:hypothetical protein